MNLIAISLGKRINYVRKRQNVTSEKLAELCDVGSVHIRKIESGTKLPSITLFIKICNVLKISPQYLLQDNLELNIMNTIHEDLNAISENLLSINKIVDKLKKGINYEKIC